MVSFNYPRIGVAGSGFFRSTLWFGLFFSLLTPQLIWGQDIRISEVMASNGDTVADEDGDYEDWIELHNFGSAAVNIEGWGLSDAYDQPFRWSFPAMILGPGEYVLVWASGKDRVDPGQPLHTNFSISSAGEEIILSRHDGALWDELPPTALPRDVSIGRLAGQGDDWYYFQEPTPGGPNTATGYDALLERPEFSHTGGFHPASFSLTLSAEPGATILYTLDGSEPDPENIGGRTYQYKNQYAFGSLLERQVETFVYDGPIPVSNRTGAPNPLHSINTLFSSSTSSPPGQVFRGQAVRAKAVREGALPSRSETHTYVIHSGEGSRYDLMMVAVTTDEPHLFDYVNGIYVAGKIAVDWREQNPNATFDGNSPANFQGRGIEWERPAHIEVFEPNGERVLAQGVGLRLHGGWSRFFAPRKSLRLYARSDYDDINEFNYPFFPGRTKSGDDQGPLDTFRRLILRNSGNDHSSTLLRDAVIHEMVRDLPVDSQGYRPAVHLINGEYWGINNIRERLDQHYVAVHYGIDPDNVAILDHSPVVNPEYIGMPMPNLGVSTGTDADRDQYLAMHQFAVENDLSDDAAFAHLATMMDVENFALYCAIQIYIGNDDWPQNNMDFWRKRTDGYLPDAPYGHDGRWRWMLYDLDFAFNSGAVSRNSLTRVVNNSNVGGFAPAPWANQLLQQLLANEGFRHYFINTLNDLDKKVFHPSRINPLIDQVHAGLASSRQEHWARWGSGTSSPNFMKDFASARGSHVRGHLASVFGLPGTTTLAINDIANPGGRVRVNGLLLDSSLPGVDLAPDLRAPVFGPQQEWKFLDDGSDQGGAWRDPGFDDAQWESGQAAFGYGEAGNFLTEIDYGSDPQDRPITTYFRKPFVWDGDQSAQALNLSLATEGGAVVYLNGQEILRHRMPEGPIDYTTPSQGGLDPAAFDGLAAWYDAGAEVEVRLARGVSYVTSWRDLSGNDRHAAQTSPVAQPRLRDAALSERPVVQFDGIDHFLQAPIVDTRGEMTLFAVVRVESEGNAFGSYLGLSGAGQGNVSYHVGSGGGRGLGIGQPNQNLAQTTAASDRFEVIRIEAHGDYRHTLTRLSSGQTVTAQLAQTGGVVDRLLLGAAGNADNIPVNRLPVEIAELLVFDRELPETDSFRIARYLSNKYEIPVAPAFAAGIDDLRLWLAADGPMNTRTAFFSGNQFVTSWTDLSGQGSHAVQSQNSAQPQFIENALNGRPVLRFDGGNDFVEAPVADPRSGMTLFMVARLNDNGAPFASYAGLNGAGAGNVWYHVGTGDGRSQGLGIGVAQPGQNLGVNNLSSRNYELIRIEANADSLHRIRRVLSGQSATGQLSNLSGTVQSLSLGGSRQINGGIGNFLPMDVAEVMLFGRELNPGELLDVETYLALKYGFEPPSWVPYAVSAAALVEGENLLAVEVHQESPAADRFFFDARLEVTLRGPVPSWTGIYMRDVPVTIEAIPEAGYRLVGWMGSESTDPVLNLSLNGHGELSPIFEFDEASLEEMIPAPHPLAQGPYRFERWDADEPAGTYPPHIIFEQTVSGDPPLNAEMTGYWVLPYDLESRSRINGLGDEGVAFINTGNAQDHPEAGYLGSAVLALDTRGVDTINVMWTGGTVTPNDRVYALRLQYRAGDEGPFSDLQDSGGAPIEYVRHAMPAHSELIGPVRLPAQLEGLPYVQLRWKYYHVSGDSGPRAQLRLDDIVVTSGATGPAESLEFTQSFSGSRQSGETLPALAVRAVDASGMITADFSGTISLTVNGDAVLEGENTLVAVDGVATFEDLRLSGVGLVSLTATANGLNPVSSEPFRVVRLSEIVMPLWIQGEQDAVGDNLNRVPYAFRLSLEGLLENAVYRFGNRIVDAEDPPLQNGAGNTVWVTGPDSDWIRNTDSPRFLAADTGFRHYTFTTDADGRFEGWFITEPSGNARFTPGNTVWVRLLLNDGEDGEEISHILSALAPVGVVGWGDGPGQATAVMGSASAAPRSVVLLFDNETGEGRPLAATPVEMTGSEVDSRYAPFYHETVAAADGLWGSLIPNGLTSGIRRIEERSAENGALLAVRRFPQGIPSTVHAASGLQPLLLEAVGGETYAGWLEVRFPDPEDRSNPDLAAPEVDPGNLGVPNLMRYALDIPENAPAWEFLPRVEIHNGRLTLIFRRSADKHDIAYLVRASGDLTDWSQILYDSRLNGHGSENEDEVRVEDSVEIEDGDNRRYLRLEIIQLP